MNIYRECKNMPNPSKGLLNLFKKHPNDRLWVINYDQMLKRRYTSLQELKKNSINNLELIIGYPYTIGDPQKITKATSFFGTSVIRNMFTGGDVDFKTCFIGNPYNPCWFVDRTEEIVEGLKDVGSCFISKDHCVFEQVSSKVKQCKYCKRKLYKKIKVIKEVVWEYE